MAKVTEKILQTKQQKIEKEKASLIEHLDNGDTKRIIHKVAWILNHYPEARNSDVTCMLKYWEIFEPETYKQNISAKELYKLTRLTSIARSRAKIQNEYRLFLADKSVSKKRRQLAEEEKTRALEDKPEQEMFSVYGDETGKTDKYISVGSLWVLDAKLQIPLVREIMELKNKHNYSHEIHFKEIKRDSLPFYLELVDVIHNNSSAFSFKAISISHDGIKNINDALEDMFYHLLIKGIEHELQKKRAALPRSLQFIKDADSEGSDKLMLANIKQKLKDYSSLYLASRLIIDEFRSKDSKHQLNLQIADMYTSTINRLLNHDPESSSYKNDVAAKFQEKMIIDRKNDGDYTFWGDL